MIFGQTYWQFLRSVVIIRRNSICSPQYGFGANDIMWMCKLHGPLARYVKLRVAHAPGMPGTFSPPSRISDPDMHHGTCVMHVPWCMPGSLTSGFLWSRWRWKRSRHSRCMRNMPFYVSGKRLIPRVTVIQNRNMVLRAQGHCFNSSWPCDAYMYQ